MDTGPLVESRIDDGRYLLEKLAASGFDVSAAAWVKTADDEEWNLYIVSRTVAEQGLASAYGAARAALGQIPDPWVSTSDLKLVRPDSPFGQRLLEIQKPYSDRTPARLRSVRVGDVAALEVYLYPPVTQAPPAQQPLTPQEVFQKVVELMARTGQVPPPSRVTLRDGTTFLGVPFGLELSSGKRLVKFAVGRFEPPRVYSVEEIRAIE
jgi:hypothetical protein